LPRILIANTWHADRHWKKSLRKVPRERVEFLVQALLELVAALEHCAHPQLSPELQRWSPVKYHSPRKKKGEWVEYHLGDRGNRARVVVCYLREEDVIFLVARTAIHDHRRLRMVTEGFDRSEQDE